MKEDNSIFIDTNILVYAYDSSAGEKHKKAVALFDRLAEEERVPSISSQVLNELAVNLIRKGQSINVVKNIMTDHCQWNVITHQSLDTVEALDLMERWKLSFWDALILLAAHRSGASVLWSEDFNDRQNYHGIVVKNPFLKH